MTPSSTILLFSLWCCATCCWTLLLSFFSTQEMACISYHRLKLESAARGGNEKAIKIKFMLENPLLLFGTTLFGVNVCLVLSSESARQAFATLGWNPNLSAFVQIPYVLIFGELIPMFAARLFPEHMARLGIPLLWRTSRILAPFLRLSSATLTLFQKSPSITKKQPVLQLDELHELLQESFEPSSMTDTSIDTLAAESISTRLFSLREKSAERYMIAANNIPSISSGKTIASCRIQETCNSSHLLLTDGHKKIVGILSYNDLCQASFDAAMRTKPVSTLALPMCYITEDTSLSAAFARLRKEECTLTFVINSQGNVSGILPFSVILDEVLPHPQENFSKLSSPYIEKTITGDEKVLEFLHKHGISLTLLDEPVRQTLLTSQDMTFSTLCEKLLHRTPNKGDVIDIGTYRIAILNISFFGIKKVFISNK